MFTRIGIVTKMHEPAVKNALETLIRLLNERGLEVLIDQRTDTAGMAGVFQPVSAAALPDSCDLVVSLGGDGTLLQSAGLIYPRDVPLVGVNLGRLGFLTDLAQVDASSGLSAVLDGHYVSEERAVLGCEIVRGGEVVASEDGLNDVVVQKWNTARLITLETYVDGKFLHSQRADGMIVATPTGSTAYSLSGGGPILDPQVGALVLVPICPHTLTNRPIVVSDSVQIEIHVATEREDESCVTCDGNSIQDLLPGDHVRVFRRKQSITLLHPANYDHFATLRAKLNWGREPC
ncbi:MAG: NAD(+) kinase [Gammaproteobacteria bacterium]|nr:NAD(+) kinase [Gammaproteobacteria bacterium]